MPPSSPPLPLPRDVYQTLAHRTIRMRGLRSERRSWKPLSRIRIHALTLCITSIVMLAFAILVIPRELDLGKLWADGKASAIMILFHLALVPVLVHRGTTAMWTWTVQGLGRAIGVRPVGSAACRLAWLDRHWLGALSQLDVEPSAGGTAVTFTWYGYPVLVMADPLPIIGLRPARFELLLAASIPPHHAQKLLEVWPLPLRRCFTLTSSEAGLRASATTTFTAALANQTDPWRKLPLDAQTLVAILHAFVTAAWLLHAKPIEPVP